MGDATTVFGEERMQKEKKEIIQELSKKKSWIQGKLKAEETNRNKQVPQRHVHGGNPEHGGDMVGFRAQLNWIQILVKSLISCVKW